MGELSRCWREVSVVFCCALSCSTFQGHLGRRLRFGVVQDGCGEEPFALWQPGGSQSTPCRAGLADGGRAGRWGAGKRENMECGAAWQRLQDAPSAPCFCLRPLQGSTEPLHKSHTGPAVHWPLVQTFVNAVCCWSCSPVCDSERVPGSCRADYRSSGQWLFTQQIQLLLWWWVLLVFYIRMTLAVQINHSCSPAPSSSGDF